MIFCAVSSLMPGSFIRSSLLALLMSTAGARLVWDAMRAGCDVCFAAVAEDDLADIAEDDLAAVPCAAYAAIGRTIARASAESVRNWSGRIMTVLLWRANPNTPPRPPGGWRGDGSQAGPGTKRVGR